MKKFILLTIIIIMMFSLGWEGCTAFRAVRYGSPTVDTYLDFSLDTVFANDKIKSVLCLQNVMTVISKIQNSQEENSEERLWGNFLLG